MATPATATVKDLDGINPDWSILDWEEYKYTPLNTRVAIPNMARGCPFTCSFCSQWKFWRDYRVRDPKKVVDEIEKLVRDHQIGFFILADEEPTVAENKEAVRLLREADILVEAQMDDWEASADKAAKAAERREALRAQGKARAAERLANFTMPNGAEVKVCGGGTQQMEDV